MENLTLFKSENPPAGDRLKGKDAAVGIGSGRKKLAEITNLQCAPQPKSSSPFEKAKTVSLSAKDFIIQLQNENMGLKKALLDRNKHIESSRVELQKLTVHFEKVQQQNVQLAQANSQLLQELNTGKDRLKALQHELGCKNGLLKALQLKAKALPAASQAHLKEVETSKTAKDRVLNQLVNKNEDEVQDRLNPSDRRRQSHRVATKPGVRRKVENLTALSVDGSLPRRQSMRLKSDASHTSNDVLATNETYVPICSVSADQVCESALGSQDISERKIGGKTKAVNQDACSRRQSRRFKLDVTQTSEDICETGKDQTPACIAIATGEIGHDGTSNVPKLVLVKEGNVEVDLAAGSKVSSYRHSVGRPLRNAAVRIQSYKELPLNIKMRRNEDPSPVVATHALVVATMISAGLRISGGHLNPAVTLGLHITVFRSVLYWIDQLLASAAACALLTYLTGGLATPIHSLSSEVSYLARSDMGDNTHIFTTIVDPKKGSVEGTGFVVGANIFAEGASMNPARSCGPALISGDWTDHWGVTGWDI